MSNPSAFEFAYVLARETSLKPRKIPAQSRSEATVEAIFEGAIQVLVEVGPRQLTTTRVAERAGVSVGTLYQYFANIDGLMAAIVERHLGTVRDAVVRTCAEERGKSLYEMARALADSFVDAKSERLDVTKALYAVAYDLKGRDLCEGISQRSIEAISEMLTTASDAVIETPNQVAAVIHAAIAGAAQIALSRTTDQNDLYELRRHIRHLVAGYLDSLAAAPDK